jgi:hypothetical protein
MEVVHECRVSRIADRAPPHSAKPLLLVSVLVCS